MDPISIASAVTGIVFTLAKVGRSLAILYETYKTSQQTIFSIQTECTTIAAALSTIQAQVTRSQKSNVPPDLVAALDIALTGCGMTLEVLVKELESLLENVGGSIKAEKEKGRWMKIGKSKQISFVWNEGGMLALLGQLRGQSAAMMLLLRAMDSISMERVLDILENGRGTLEVVRSVAATLREAELRNGGKRYPESVLEMREYEREESIYELFGEAGISGEKERGRDNAKVLRAGNALAGSLPHRKPVGSVPIVAKSQMAESVTMPPANINPPPFVPQPGTPIPIIQRQQFLQTDNVPDEESNSEDTPWLVKGRSSIRQNLFSLLSNLNSPGIAIGMLSGRTKEIHVAGVRKLGNSTLITQSDLFPMAHLTDFINMTLLARIIEKPDNDLDWDTPIADALPANMGHKIHPAHRNTTLERLSSHTAGFVENLVNAENGALWPYLGTVNGHTGRLAIAKSVLSRPPDNPNIGTDIRTAPAANNLSNSALVALAIETVTNSTWEAAVQKEIFEPLEMYHSGFGQANAEKNSGSGDPVQPWPHNLNNNPNPVVGSDGVVRRFIVYAGPDPGTVWAVNPPAAWPLCGIHTSMADLLSFCDIHMRGLQGDESAFWFLRKETFEKLHEGVGPGGEFTRAGMVTWTKSWTRGRVRHLGGWSHGGTGKIWLMPEMGRAIVCLANVAGEVGEELADAGVMVCVRKIQGEGNV